jgi:cell division protein YceG involved in septum cleavage
LYSFKTEAGYSSIADMLVNEGAKAKCVKVVIPEGTGINDYTHIVDGEEKVIKGITTILSDPDNFVCSREDFLSALYEVKFDSRLLKNCNIGKTYYSLEGYLFPDTYEFYAYDSEECARLVVEKLIKNAKDGEIIRLNINSESTVEGVVKAVKELQADGFEFVRVDDLLTRNGDKLARGMLYRKCKFDTKPIAF